MLRKSALNSLPIPKQSSNGGNACFTAFSCFPEPQNFCTTGCFSGICTAPQNSLHRILELEEVLLPYGYRNRLGTVKRLLSVTWPGTGPDKPRSPIPCPVGFSTAPPPCLSLTTWASRFPSLYLDVMQLRLLLDIFTEFNTCVGHWARWCRRYRDWANVLCTFLIALPKRSTVLAHTESDIRMARNGKQTRVHVFLVTRGFLGPTWLLRGLRGSYLCIHTSQSNTWYFG